MSTPNDGGPAFPQAVPPGVIGAGCGPHVEWGMTRRDWLAAHCPLTLEQSATLYGLPLDDILRDPVHSKAFWALHADECLAYASAMINASKPLP